MINRKEKQDYLKILESVPEYSQALSLVTSNEEKEKIKAFAEDIFFKLISGMAAAKNEIQKNPEKFKDELQEKMPEGFEYKIIKDK